MNRGILKYGFVACLLLSAVVTWQGCSVFVMAGKILNGDPKYTCKFRTMTNIDLTKGEHKVLIICSAPETIEASNSTLKVDLIDGITRRLKRRKIDVVNPDDVAKWIDDHGGVGNDVNELAEGFDADYIAWIDIDTFTTLEGNSSKLHRGRSIGEIRVYRVDKFDERKIASQIFVTEYTSVHPPHQPISFNSSSATVFEKEYLDIVSEQIAQTFYDYRLNDTL